MSTHHRITRVSIVGGFLDGTTIEPLDGLNCLIGARGAGKTSLLELVRFAMNVMPESPVERQRIESLLKANLGSGRVEVGLETKEGVALVVRRTLGEEPMVLTPDGKVTRYTLDHIFRLDVFSQNELEQIATDTRAQLAILDGYEPERIAEVTRRLQEVRTALVANRGKLAPLKRRAAELSEELPRLAALETRLAAMEKTSGPNKHAINRAHHEKARRDRQQRAFRAADGGLADVGRRLAAVNERLPALLRSFSTELESGPSAQLVSVAAERIRSCTELLAGQFDRLQRSIADCRRDLGDTHEQLSMAHKEQEIDFRHLIERHDEAQSQFLERVELEKQRNELLSLDANRRQLCEQVERLEAERAQLLEQLADLSHERFQLRQAAVDRINPQVVEQNARVELLQAGGNWHYQQLLQRRLEGHNLKPKLVSERLSAMLPLDLAECIAEGDGVRLVEETGINKDQARKVMAALADPDVLLELAEAELDDSPVLWLKDGEHFKRSTALSTGQKCTAVLPLLLLKADAPLAIDQLEDNIDGGFLASTIVGCIQRVKAQRQLLVITHNANIPVLADAERVFVLHSDGEHSTIIHGTVDQCRDDIVRLLEGGREAFQARQSRYAYNDSPSLLPV